jgi:ubiquitin-protein ligase
MVWSGGMIRINCPKCGKAFQVKPEYAGRKTRCRACGEIFLIENRAVPIDASPPPLPKSMAPTESHTQEKIAISLESELKPSKPAPKRDQLEEKKSEKIIITQSHLAQPVSSSPPPLPPIAPPPIAVPPDIPPRSSVVRAPKPPRIRRLEADYITMRKRFDNFPLIRIKDRRGDPPDTYIIEYLVKGLEKDAQGQIRVREQHLVEIQLTREYPRIGPKCKMLTPIFHPNIDQTSICIGDHWAAQERLSDVVVRIGELISFQNHNIKSSLDGEAGMWTDLNRNKLPIDNRNLMPPERD